MIAGEVDILAILHHCCSASYWNRSQLSMYAGYVPTATIPLEDACHVCADLLVHKGLWRGHFEAWHFQVEREQSKLIMDGGGGGGESTTVCPLGENLRTCLTQ